MNYQIHRDQSKGMLKTNFKNAFGLTPALLGQWLCRPAQPKALQTGVSPKGSGNE